VVANPDMTCNLSFLASLVMRHTDRNENDQPQKERRFPIHEFIGQSFIKRPHLNHAGANLRISISPLHSEAWYVGGAVDDEGIAVHAGAFRAYRRLSGQKRIVWGLLPDCR
jgi:hypothetical protein